MFHLFFQNKTKKEELYSAFPMLKHFSVVSSLVRLQPSWQPSLQSTDNCFEVKTMLQACNY